MSGVAREELARDELRLDWEQFANCATVDPELMFPEKGDMVGSQAARKVCVNCVVIDQCLADALVNPPDHGIRGGKTVRQIQNLRRSAAVTPAEKRAATHQARYDRAVAMRDSGMTHAAIARTLGYAWPSGASELLKSRDGEDNAS